MRTILLGDSAIEILSEPDELFRAQARFPGGKRILSDESFSRIEDAIWAALNLFNNSRVQSEVFRSFEQLHQLAVITLLLIYSYVQSPERDARITQIHTETKAGSATYDDGPSPSHDIYAQMRGPIGNYDIQDLLMHLGYLRNISQKRSRWAEIILTNSGATVAQAIQKDFYKLNPRLPGLS
jgi:hypothetical protein